MNLWLQFVLPLFSVSTSWFVYELISIIYTDNGYVVYTDEVIRDAGYPCETHKLQTEDGYILTVFRIPFGKGQKTGRRPAILLMHGMTTSSDSFVHPSTEDALAFVLSDDGFDVWLGNVRGNRYSQEHVNNTNFNKEQYWDISFHEMGYYDLPVTVSHILKVTNEEKIYLLGHSLGAAVSLVFLSLRTEFQDKIKTAIILGPAVFIGRGRSILLKKWCENIQPTFTKIYGSTYFPPSEIGNFRNYIRPRCSPEFTISFICDFTYRLIFGPTSDFNQVRYTTVMKYWPTPISLKTLRHYCQSILTGYFRPFDYGEELNLAKYGSSEPPSYEISNITTPIVLMYADGDAVVRPEDAYQLCSSLGRVVEYYRVPEPDFNHVDFILHRNAKALVYDKILELIGQGASLMNRKALCHKGTVNN